MIRRWLDFCQDTETGNGRVEGKVHPVWWIYALRDARSQFLVCGSGLGGGGSSVINKAGARAANRPPSRSAPRYLFERVSDWLWFSLSPVQRKWIDGNQSPAGLSSGLPMNRLCTEHFFFIPFFLSLWLSSTITKKCNCIIYQAYIKNECVTMFNWVSPRQ